MYGHVGERNYDKAFDLLTDAINEGIIDAHAIMSDLYVLEDSAYYDTDKAMKVLAPYIDHCIKTKTLKKNIRYLVKLANLYYHEDMLKESFEMFSKGMELGDANSYFSIASFYQHGWHVKRNINKAIELFRKCAMMNVFSDGFMADTFYRLGQSYILQLCSKLKNPEDFEYCCNLANDETEGEFLNTLLNLKMDKELLNDDSQAIIRKILCCFARATMLYKSIDKIKRCDSSQYFGIFLMFYTKDFSRLIEKFDTKDF